MHSTLKNLLTAFALLAALPAAAQDYSSLYKDLPVELEQVSAPVIASVRVSIVDFGAAGDGVTLCTEAFGKAIGALSEKGGGHVDVPAGVWLTGPIVLKSGIDLHVERGAIIVFTPDKRAYLPDGSKGRATSCISAEKATDISITGEGILDGNGKYWRYAKQEKMSAQEWGDLRRLGGTLSEDGRLWFPSGLKNFEDVTGSPEEEESLRAHMVLLKRCKNVLISGVTIQNAPRFHINPSMCENLIIDGVTVRCPWNAQNGDGIDIGNCRRVLITGCTLDVGDDGICMKGGSGEKGLKNGPCRDILICGNTVFHAHGGFVIGSDCSGGMERIVVRGCSFSGTDTGLRFKSALGRGGRCKDIFISDIAMNDIRGAAVTFSCDYSDITYKTVGAPQGTEFAPDFSDIHISVVVCRECLTGVEAKGIAGYDCVHDVTVSGSTFFHTGRATDIDSATAKIDFEDVRFVTY